MKMRLIMGGIAAALLLIGCSNSVEPAKKAEVKPTVSEESLGLRKTDLYTEQGTKPAMADYSAAAPGTSQRIERAYDNAPPMIPHDVEGLLPISEANNACLGCHMPDMAAAMGATPIPESHFANFRPDTSLAADGKITKEGKEVDNTGDFKMIVKKSDHLYQGRFNCSQCHAPQANIAPAVANTFRPDYQDETMKNKSDLLDVLNVGVQ